MALWPTFGRGFPNTTRKDLLKTGEAQIDLTHPNCSQGFNLQFNMKNKSSKPLIISHQSIQPIWFKTGSSPSIITSTSNHPKFSNHKIYSHISLHYYKSTGIIFPSSVVFLKSSPCDWNSLRNWHLDMHKYMPQSYYSNLKEISYPTPRTKKKSFFSISVTVAIMSSHLLREDSPKIEVISF